MFRKVVCGAVILVLCVGLTLADEFRAVITKVEGDKVTFTKTKFDPETKKLEKGQPTTLPVAANVKVVKAKFNPETKKFDAGDPIEGGLKNKMFTDIQEKGVPATIITDADNKKITEIRAGGFGGFKKGKGKDK
ncbi:MAG TPA: hypothetical protein VNK04_22945 [Gemmataceae bacterium]|nr:hypothetical protein [Gemmataceae bacterium]